MITIMQERLDCFSRQRLHQERSDFLSEMEKKLADSLAKAAAALPESKREFLLGYAEGVAAMTEAKEPAAPAVEDKPEEPAS